MDLSLLTANLLNPPLLFFFLGFVATLIKSDLEIPQPLPRLFSLYLLCAIGLQGGVELHEAGLSWYVVSIIGAVIASAIIIPVYSYFILRRSFNVYDSAAIAASYGSVSAVTFITATSLLNTLGVPYSGFMIAAMAMMESPAIIIGILLVSRFAQDAELNWTTIIHDALSNSAVVLILGSLGIGLLVGPTGYAPIKPFFTDIFKGTLSLFLLDMGLVSARRLSVLLKKSHSAISFALIIPFVNAAASIMVAKFLELSIGDAFLFACLCASASYIAVPAAMRIAVPESNPSLYIPMAMGLTFPINILIGLPIYLKVINYFWS